MIECLGEVEEEDMIDSLEEVDDDEAIDEEDNSEDNDSKDHGIKDEKDVKTNDVLNHVEEPDIFELDSEEDVALPLTFNCREDLNRKLARTSRNPVSIFSPSLTKSIPITPEPTVIYLQQR